MLVIDFTNAGTVILALVLYLLVLILSKETKKSVIPGIMLFVFLTILIVHSVLLTITDPTQEQYLRTITRSIGVDLVFIFLSFITYLWIDEIEAKLKKKKTLNSGLDWFWKKI